MLRRFALILALVLALPAAAHAQAELSGTYFPYVGTRANGSMINSSNRSMSYRESAAVPATCDLYFPGSPVEGFTVDFTGTSFFRATNSYSRSDIPTVSGPVVSGRSILWSGQYVSGSNALRIDQSMSFADTDRVMTLAVRLTNVGSSTLSEVHYLRNGDPDHAAGGCIGASSHVTTNDVLRQPPGFTSALVVASAGTAPNYTVGIGAHDARARVTAQGFDNTDATGEWNTPRDPNGLAEDIGVDIVLKEGSLAPGATTLFTIYYVWGTTVADVITRFDGLSGCGLFPDGTTCLAAGVVGTCRAGNCCTGCWNGTLCQPGTALAVCGSAGSFCAGCADVNPCTAESCTAGACVASVLIGQPCDDARFCTVDDACGALATCEGAPRDCDDPYDCTNDSCDELTGACVTTPVADTCLVDGACVLTGSSPADSNCLVCDPARATDAWSPLDAGRGCDDGTYCTSGDTCDGAGVCVGTARSCDDGVACTDDSCNEELSACVRVQHPGTCVIEGVCSFAGPRLDHTCLVCDPARSTTGWSLAPAGTPCDDGAYCTLVDTCAPDGDCIGTPRPCDDALDCTLDYCDEGARACQVTLPGDSCLIDGVCVQGGATRPGFVCEGCVPGLAQDRFTMLPAGTRCGDPSCADGVQSLAATCDGEGACSGGAEIPCGSGRCTDAVSCSGTCANDDECLFDHYCSSGGTCLPDTIDGSPCERAESCESGACIDGVCTAPPVEAPPVGGCDCHASGNGSGADGAGALLLVGAALLFARRRRRN